MGKYTPSFSNLRGDLLGGLTSAIISVPIAIAIGITAFAPLGLEFIAEGINASLAAVMISVFLTSVLGGTPGQITCPTIPLAVIGASMMTHLMQDEKLDFQAILLILSIIVLGSGLLQLLLGFVGGGKVIKYIPYPVVAGFSNGIALLLLNDQIQPLLGADTSSTLTSILEGQVGVHYGALFAGITTVLTSLIGRLYIKKLPIDIIAFFAGIATFFAIGALFSPEMLRLENNPLIIGSIQIALPSPKRVVTFLEFMRELSLSQWMLLVVPSLTMSVLASIDGLLATVAVDKMTRTRNDGNLELLGQGVCNIASALFGGLAVAGGLPETLANISTGGRTMLSGIFASLFVFLIVMVLNPFVRWIPFSVLAGLLVLLSFRLFEIESFNLFKKKSTFESLLVMIIVTLITFNIDLVISVSIGLVIASLLFVKDQIGQTIVRRKYTGDLVHSKTVRDPEARRILQEHGSLITVYQLSGSLFFGTCDKLLIEIEIDKSHYLIFDLKRVSSIDITGAQLLLQIVHRVQDEGHQLFLANLDVPGDPDKVRLRKFLEDVEVVESIGADHIFPDLDLALERAENLLIDQITRKEQLQKQMLSLHNLSVFSDLNNEQVQRVQPYFDTMEFRQGDIVFKQGDPGDGMYFILSGYVSVIVEMNKQERRLATFAEGVFFGDMAILEDQPRSATIRSESDTHLLFLSKSNFYKLIEKEPLIANRILLGISRELAYRLRLTNAEIATLAE